MYSVRFEDGIEFEHEHLIVRHTLSTMTWGMVVKRLSRFLRQNKTKQDKTTTTIVLKEKHRILCVFFVTSDELCTNETLYDHIIYVIALIYLINCVRCFSFFKQFFIFRAFVCVCAFLFLLLLCSIDKFISAI